MNDALVPPATAQQRSEAAAAARALEGALAASAQAAVRMAVFDGRGGSVAVTAPRGALEMLRQALLMQASGAGVTLVPSGGKPLSTQKAADLLGVSRPFLLAEIAAGRLHCHMVGTHRRISLDDLRRYQGEHMGGAIRTV